MIVSSPQHLSQTPDDTGDDQRNVSESTSESMSVTNGDSSLPVDECWLYKPSNITVESVIPITTWLRDIFDSPKSVFSQSKRNLLTRLEVILATGGQIAAYRFGGSVPSLNLLTSAPPSARSSQRVFQGSAFTASWDIGVRKRTGEIHSVGSSDSISAMTHKPDGVAGYSLHFNHFTRPVYSLPPQISNSQRLTTTSDSANCLAQSLGNHFHRKWSGSTGKMGSCDALETLHTDVQEIARIQEDNLKAEVAALAAAAACRRGSQHSLSSHEGSLVHLTSAPGSPAASNSRLDQLQSSNLSVNDTILADRSDGTSFLHSGSSIEPTCPAEDSNTYSNRFQASNQRMTRPNNTNTKFAFSVLPQKPSIPLTNHQSSDVSSDANSFDAKLHFGFRPMRKVSMSQYSSRPPVVPTSTRRSSFLNPR